MIGIGKWHANVNNKFFTGGVDFEITDNNGEYVFDIKLPEKFKGIDYKYFDIVEKGNVLTCKGKCSAFPKITIRAELKFNGDKAEIKFSAPPVPATVKIKDVHKVG